MQMKASELPYEVKQNLLRQIKDQAGSSQYHEMVARVGEDGLIDLAIQKMEELSGSPSVKEKKTRGQKAWFAIKVIFGVLVVAIWMRISPESLGQLVLVVGGYIAIIWLWAAVSKWWNENMTFPRRW